MLSKRVDELPVGESWIFEPKWDGFRALIFRDGDEILIQSRDEKPLNRYFPELLEPLRAQLPARCVLDGEIVIAQGWRARFRRAATPPSSGRVAREAAVASKSRRRSCSSTCFARATATCGANRFRSGASELESLLSSAAPPIHLTPATRDRSVASDWFRRFEGAGLDGVMAKPVSGAYESEQARDAQGQARARLRLRGRRLSLAQEGRAHGGRLAAARALRRCGRAAARRRLRELHAGEAAWNWWSFSRPIARTRSPIIPGKLGGAWSRQRRTGHRMPGGQSRWSQGKDLSWEPLRPELVVEVAYEHMQGTRFRHMAQFRQMAHRQEAERLHLCAARSGPAAGADGDFRRAAADAVYASS